MKRARRSNQHTWEALPTYTRYVPENPEVFIMDPEKIIDQAHQLSFDFWEGKQLRSDKIHEADASTLCMERVFRALQKGLVSALRRYEGKKQRAEYFHKKWGR